MNNNLPVKIFYCQHPASIIFFKNLAGIIREKDRQCRIILVLSAHPYFQTFNLKPYVQSFNEIVKLDYVSYRKNIAAGILAAWSLRKRIRQLTQSWSLLYFRIDLFLMDSAWLPANLFLYYFAYFNRKAHIVRFFVSLPQKTERTSSARNFLISWYHIFCGGYKVKTIISPAGKFLDLYYQQPVPGEKIIIIAPGSSSMVSGYESMSYPAPRSVSKQVKDMVIVFGDATLFDFYSAYLPTEQECRERLKLLFSSLESHYVGGRLFYKPHPGDKGKLMPGPEYSHYQVFTKDMNAETIIDQYQEHILAVYSFASTSSVAASFYRIPAYTYYRYLCNAAGKDKFDRIIGTEYLQSPYLCHLSELKDIGKVDCISNNIENSESADQEKVNKILNISG
ncbi:MAG: hypothetical protein PHV60_00465 [bacterium]|nr:hypothetical protein [bacterium]